MNLNQLTAKIGASIKGTNEFSSLVKEVSVKEDDYNYTVFLVFDIDRQEIYFDSVPEPFSKETLYKYNYFGNNPGASMQFYLTRELKSAGYLLGSVFSDLTILMNKHNFEGTQLYNLLEKMQSAKLITIADKKGQGTVLLNKFSFNKSELNKVLLSSDKKAILIEKEDERERYSIEKLVRIYLEDNNKKNKFILAVPVVKLQNEIINLSIQPEYLDVVKAEMLGGKTSKAKKKTVLKVCYLCQQKKDDVNYECTKKLNKSRINKIFTTTTINTAPNFISNNYDYVYAICQDCYNLLLAGEKEISEKFQTRIAGERVFILPEAVNSSFNYEHFKNIKTGIDFAFNKAAESWVAQIDNEVGLMNIVYGQETLYTVNMVLYRTDGKSISILQIIEDVPVLRFDRVIRAIAKNRIKLGEDNLKYMSLGSIYRIIPVKSSKKKEQLDVGRVLTLYKVLLTGGNLRIDNLYNYALEALDKGLKQLGKKQIDNYWNMDLIRYKNGREDFFIKNIVMSYLVLIQVFKQFEIIKEHEPFRSEGGNVLNLSSAPKIEQTINNMEEFLEKQQFTREARALFYLGGLIQRVALAQLKKEHKTKPVLKKISFQGMNKNEIFRLYNDVIEKLRQYDKMTLYSETLMNRFHFYAGNMLVDRDADWRLGEQANVFYIMSGYAYMIGRKTVDADSGEKQAFKEYVEEVANDDNK